MNNALIASFWESGWFARVIIIILFVLSIYTWAIIAMKWRLVKEITTKKAMFLEKLNQNREDILALYKTTGKESDSPFQYLYNTICAELNNMLVISSQAGKPGKISAGQFNNLSELANITISGQIISLERYLIVLATTASASPLLGLLGTVWGVLISFRGMASLGTASLAVIAPGISEALVTTVAGLIVAIPALVGYNWITNKTQILTRELDNFSSRLLSYIQAAYHVSAYEKELIY